MTTNIYRIKTIRKQNHHPRRRNNFLLSISRMRHYISLFKTLTAHKLPIVQNQIITCDNPRVKIEPIGRYYSLYDVEVLQSNLDGHEFRLHLLEGIINQRARFRTKSKFNCGIQVGRIHQGKKESFSIIRLVDIHWWSISLIIWYRVGEQVGEQVIVINELL